MKISKDFLIVAPNEIYPTQLRAGDECPEWAIRTAKTLGVLETPRKAPRNKMDKTKLETK